VLVKFVALIMRADNDGEGGIMALVSLIIRERHGHRVPRRLVLLGIVGAALVFGDSLITPAISVLSAVEGLELLNPALSRFVLPGAVAIIVGLFALQRRGTAVIGAWFGPVMLVRFTAIGLCGLRGVITDPGVLRGLSPISAVQFLRTDGLTGYLALGGVVLAVTGAEALSQTSGTSVPRRSGARGSRRRRSSSARSRSRARPWASGICRARRFATPRRTIQDRSTFRSSTPRSRSGCCCPWSPSEARLDWPPPAGSP
jgi:hypothetical protein